MEMKKDPGTHYINSNVIPVFGIRSGFCCIFFFHFCLFVLHMTDEFGGLSSSLYWVYNLQTLFSN